MAKFEIQTSASVRAALAAGQPVLALESTIFTHGLPRPRNIEVAREGEALAARHGVLAATIGIVRGVPTVGLTQAEILELASDDKVRKASERDLATTAVAGANAGTTIAATAWLAHQAGIRVFATGGLGGVHHGASTSFDESADLVALARTPIVLVSSGVKAILDIPATLERLETLSVPVVGYRTNRFPGFYVVDSGHAVPERVETPGDVAALARAHSAFGLESALLVANPVPADRALDPAELEEALRLALDEAGRRGIHGPASTPFLLDFIQAHTQGRSLDANVALYFGNVELGCQVARALVDAEDAA